MGDNNVKMNDHAINFLLYSYFGITPKDDWEMCVKKAIIKAYGDATMQGAYNTLFDKKNFAEEDLKNLKNNSDNAKKNAASHIFNEVKNLLSNDKCTDEFDTWFGKLCNDILVYYKGVNDKYRESRREKKKEVVLFAYGNAQKWINMTIKYLCILDAIKPNEYHDRIVHFASVFHVPVDSYIIEAAKETVPEQAKPWSQWDNPEKYLEYQKSLKNLFKKDETSLEWEAYTWIDAAENKKKNENKKRFKKFFDE